MAGADLDLESAALEAEACDQRVGERRRRLVELLAREPLLGLYSVIVRVLYGRCQPSILL